MKIGDKEQRMKILLIDDDLDECHFFAETLKAAQIPAVLQIENDCRNVTKLLQESNPPDLIFLDLNMPVLSGKECLFLIRGIPSLDETPVIIFSESCALPEVNATFDAGATLYVQKPAGFETLKSMLNKLLGTDWTKSMTDRKRSSFVYSHS